MSSEPSPRAADEELPAGHRVGEFEVREKLAQGGMGGVYAAVHPVIGKRAAIKVLHSELCMNPQAVQRFVDEARAVNQIRHPNIVDVFAFGRLPDQRSYFIMEWLEGETLTKRLVKAEISSHESIELLLQLCDALRAAHEKGVIHRDIKPDNIQLVPGREGLLVKLLDFGIAKLSTTDNARITGPRVAIGTPDYISPEQACGEDVDFASDVYSLGVVAYELFTGRRPFYGENIRQVMTQHVTVKPPPPSEFVPDIPPALERLLLSMLEKDAKQRVTLSDVQRTLEDMRRASQLLGPKPQPEHLRRRPVLHRRYEHVGDLARPLITELSSAVTWARTETEPPRSGTPITIRYEVPDLALALDFGGVIERHLGGENRTLIRFDRVPKSRLDRIFGLGASLSGIDTEGQPPIESWSWPSPDATGIAAPSRSSSGVDAGAPPAIETLVVSPLKRPDASPELPTSITREGRALEEREATVEKAKLGLGLRIVALSITVACGAVIAVMALAIDRVRSDRQFYVDELVLRTSQQVSDSIAQKRQAWRELLALVAANEGGLKVIAEDLDAVARCERGSCRAIKGEAPASATVEALGGAAEGQLVWHKSGDDQVFAVRFGDALAIGRIAAQDLIDRRRIPASFTVQVADENLDLIASTDPSQPWPPVAAWKARAPSGAGTASFQSADATKMMLGWTASEDAIVAVAAPSSISSKAVGLLARNIALVAAVVLAFAALIAGVFGRRMTKRLRKLTAHASRVGRGQFAALDGVGGQDEVGMLANSFNKMTRALRERDEEVLRIRQRLSEEESRSLRQQMSEWLEADLSMALTSMNEILAAKWNEESPARDFQARQSKLRLLIQRANAALENAFTRAAIASRRVDFGSTVLDAVEFAKSGLDRSDLDVSFVAPNAVLFPRLPAQESEIREIVSTLISYGAKNAPSGARITISLDLSEDMLRLAVEYALGGGSREAAASAIAAVEAMLIAHQASATLVNQAGSATALLEFPVSTNAEAPA